MELLFMESGSSFHPRVTQNGAVVAVSPFPVHLVLGSDEYEVAYEEVVPVDGGFVGSCSMPLADLVVRVADTWASSGDDEVSVVRRLRAQGLGRGPAAAVQLRLHLDLGLAEEARFFAPGIAYVPDQWVGGGTYAYSDHRLAYPVTAAYLPGRHAAISLERASVARYDNVPVRGRGQSVFVQETDIGSVGFSLNDGRAGLCASWPYAEIDASSMLDGAGTSASALHPVPAEGLDVTVEYRLRLSPSDDYADAVRHVFGACVSRTQPAPTALPVSFEESIDLRLDSAGRTYTEFDDGFAGFALNFDPELGYSSQARAFGASFADHHMDGSCGILEYGFTGRQLNLAYMLARRSPEEWSERSARVVNSFVDRMVTPSGWVHTLWDTNRRRALYACGDAVGTVLHYLGESDVPGTYTRMMTEAGSDLVLNVDLRGDDITGRRWWAAALGLADFLLRVQEDDGSWYRAYSPDGRPLVDGEWFGARGGSGKSATSAVVPFLLDIADRAADPDRYIAAAERAANYILREHTARDEYRGGTLDNPNVVDKEAAFLAMRALFSLYRRAARDELLDGARRAATLAVTWHSVWEVPAIPGTPLGVAGVRSVGWGGINPVWGVGVTDIYSLFFLRELHELGVLLGDRLFVDVAELVAHSSVELLAIPDDRHGFADTGMQPEGIAFCSQGVDDGLISKGDTWGGLGWPYTAGTFALDRYLEARATA